MKKAIIISSVVLGILILIGAGYFGVASYQKRQNVILAKERIAAEDIEELKIGPNGISASFYPKVALEINTYTFNDHIYDGLVTFDENLNLMPMIAQSWENPDNKTWRFRLRKDVTFHDGSKLTADDVVASLSLAMANEEASQLMPTVTAVKKIDDYTVDLLTSTPTPTLANCLTYIFILPKSVIDAKDFEHPIGSGEYRYISGTDREWKLERYENYYGEKPKAKKVTLKLYEDEDERIAALKNGEIDIAEISENHTESLVTKSGEKIIISNNESIEVYFISLNSLDETNPNIKGVSSNPLKSAKVREAMRLAIDVNKLINDANIPFAKPASQLVTPLVFGYNPDLKPVDYNLTEAKRLMKEAGYENGFTIVYDVFTMREKIAQSIKTQLADIGIITEINLMEPSTENYDYLFSGKPAMHSLSWVNQTGDALDVYNTILGDIGIVPGGFSNAKFKDLLGKTINTFDQTKRREYLQEMGALVYEENPVIVTHSLTTAQAYRDGITFTPRADATIQAKQAKGTVPEAIKKDYTFWTAFKKLLGLQK